MESKLKDLFEQVSQRYSVSTTCEAFAYFNLRVCKGVLNQQQPDTYCNCLFWEKSLRELIRKEADELSLYVLNRDLDHIPLILRENLLVVTVNLLEKFKDNYCMCSYYRGMIREFLYNKIIITPQDNMLPLVVKSVIGDLIEDSYISLMSSVKSQLPATPSIAPEN